MSAAPTTSRRALLVQAAGARRSGLAAALAATGWIVEALDEPYAATAHFVTTPCDLVVFSLRRFRQQDAAFLAALRARHSAVRILALVPSQRRSVAAKALQAGADAQLPEPCYPEEFVAAVEALFRHEAPGRAGGDEGLRLLAGEVAHAINNPLQILSLIGEADGLPAARAQDVRAGVGRIRQVTRILAAFGNLGAPQPTALDLGSALADALRDDGLTTPVGDVRGTGVQGSGLQGLGAQIYADPDQVRIALRTMAGFLGGATLDHQAPIEQAPIEPTIEVSNGHDPGAVLSLEGSILDATAWQQALQSVLLVHDETRAVYPGLRIAATVAALNGGALHTESRNGGIRVALHLPTNA